MQPQSVSKPDNPETTLGAESGSHDKRSRFKSLMGLRRLILGGLLLIILGSAVLYLSWDYMPARVQYIPRYIQSHLMPQKVHPAHVPTPVAVAAPEEILASLDINSTPSNEEEEAAAEAEVPREPASSAAKASIIEATAVLESAKEETKATPVAVTELDVEENAEDDVTAASISEKTTDKANESTNKVTEEKEEEEENSQAVAEEEEGEDSQALSEEEENSQAVAEKEEVISEISSEAEETPSAVLAEPLYELPGSEGFLKGIRHEFQGWNNCGPATLGMQLSFFGRPETQEITAPFLKPDENDKNVSPHELLAYAKYIGYGGQVVIGGDLEMLRTFITNGFPVIVESWFIPQPDDQMGHYLLLTGYEGDTLTFFDSYHGPNVQEKSAEFDELWKVFDRTAVVVWPPEQEELARSILGDLSEPEKMYEKALAIAHEEINANPQDKFAWFNLGSNLVALGDIPNAVKAFDTARSLELPWRMLWYQFGPYQAYYENKQYEEVISLATTTLESSENLEESLYWRGLAYAALGNTEAARSDFEQALAYNSKFTPAQEALDNLQES